ncbi:MAG: pitrilysin family protein [bacterium]
MKIPEIKEITQYKNPIMDIFKLSDNIKALVLENDLQPIAQLTIAFSSGSVIEPIPGLANFTMQMILQGTTTKTAEQISEVAENKGMKLSSKASWDESYITVTFLAEFSETAFGLIADCLLNPKFNANEVEGMKIKTLSNLEMRLSEPEYTAHLGFSYNYFNGHSYGHPHLGTRQSISSITVEDCKEMYRKLMLGKIYIIAAGNINKTQVEDFGDNHLTFNYHPEDNGVSSFLGNQDNKIYLIEKQGAAQSYLSMGIRAIGRKEENYPQFQLLNTVFGGYFGSRLNKIIREEKGFTYGVHTFNDARKYSSVLRISLGTSPEHLGEIMNIIEAEIEKLKMTLISEEEILTAKNYIAGSFLRNSETVFQSASLMLSTLINEIPIDFYETFIKKIAVTTPEDLLKTAQTVLNDYKYTMAISGDIAAMSDSLKSFKNKEVFALPDL